MALLGDGLHIITQSLDNNGDTWTLQISLVCDRPFVGRSLMVTCTERLDLKHAGATLHTGDFRKHERIVEIMDGDHPNRLRIRILDAPINAGASSLYLELRVPAPASLTRIDWTAY